MIQEQLLNLEHLAKAEKLDDKFIHIHAESGYMITSYDERAKITSYEAYECLYLPIKYGYPNYRIITKEEHLMMEERKRVELQNIKMNKTADDRYDRL